MRHEDRVRRGEYLVCGKRAICVIAATNRVLLLNAQGARYCPCVYPTGALPRLLSIWSARGAVQRQVAANNRRPAHRP